MNEITEDDDEGSEISSRMPATRQNQAQGQIINHSDQQGSSKRIEINVQDL